MPSAISPRSPTRRARSAPKPGSTLSALRGVGVSAPGPLDPAQRRAARPAEPAGLARGADPRACSASGSACRCRSRTTRTRRRSPSIASAPAAASGTSPTSRCRRASAPASCWTGRLYAGRQGDGGGGRARAGRVGRRALRVRAARLPRGLRGRRGLDAAARAHDARRQPRGGARRRARAGAARARGGGGARGRCLRARRAGPLQRLPRARAHGARLRARARGRDPRHDSDRRRRGAVPGAACARRCRRASGRASPAICASCRAGWAPSFPTWPGSASALAGERRRARARSRGAARSASALSRSRATTAASSGIRRPLACVLSISAMKVSPTPALARSCERVFCWIERISSVIDSVLLVM